MCETGSDFYHLRYVSVHTSRAVIEQYYEKNNIARHLQGGSKNELLYCDRYFKGYTIVLTLDVL